jgi:hypothetical protein
MGVSRGQLRGDPRLHGQGGSASLRLADAVHQTFITSERCTELFARIDTHTDDLLDLQVKEQKAHTATWKPQES